MVSSVTGSVGIKADAHLVSFPLSGHKATKHTRIEVRKKAKAGLRLDSTAENGAFVSVLFALHTVSLLTCLTC